MTQQYITIAQDAAVETIIKKSRFIGSVYRVETLSQGQQIIDRVKKENRDANHNCFAMVTKEGAKMSDDGEPQGTAGVPMLSVLQKAGLTGTLAIVTRYFGGILLGSGGLIRAYSKSVSDALQAAGLVWVKNVNVVKVEIPFSMYGKFEAKQYNVKEIEYTDVVIAKVYVEHTNTELFNKQITELSLGTVTPQTIGQENIEEKINGLTN